VTAARQECLLRGYVGRVIREHVDDAGVGGDFAFSFDGADADSGVVGVGEADAAQEGVDLAEFVGLRNTQTMACRYTSAATDDSFESSRRRNTARILARSPSTRRAARWIRIPRAG